MTTSNPIIQSEFRHQRFIIARGKNSNFWIFLAALLVVPSLLFSLYFTGFMLILSFQPDLLPAPEFSLITDIRGILLVVMMFAMYIVVTLISLGLANYSIGREKNGKTWDNLRLTDISARKIVWGKWWASLYAIRGDHVMSSVVRLGFLAWGLQLATVFGRVQVQHASAIMLALILLNISYSLLEAGFTVALGVSSAIPNETAGFFAGMSAVFGRILMTVLGLIWTIITCLLLIELQWLAVLGVTMIGAMIYIVAIVVVLRLAQNNVA
jgi:uncharacterized membrane protein (DUF485 family)